MSAPLVLSSSAIAAYKRCPKSFELQYVRNLEPRRTTNAIEFGSSLHEVLESYAKRTPLAPEAVDPTTDSVARAYLAHRPLPNPADTLSVEEPLYTQLLASPDVWLRTTFDLVYRRRDDGFIIARDYKGLALDTPLPTPEGWTTMGEVGVGDQLLGRNGNVCTVTAKSQTHFEDTFRVIFDDGTEVIADKDHRWVVYTGSAKRTKNLCEVVTTADLAGRHVPTCKPLLLPAYDLPVDPYVLGVWLGDGTAVNGTITSADPEVFNEIRARGYVVSENIGTGAKAELRTVYGLRATLKRLGVLGNKHIPEVYLRCSYKQRLDLLQGLMDSDGSWHKTRKRAVFVQISKRVALQVQELVRTMGVTCSLLQARGYGFKRDVVRYDVTFTPSGFNPFKLPRKATLVPKSMLGSVERPWLRGERPSQRNRKRIVRAVTAIPTVPTQCVQVDSSDHTYLATHAYIPTHNTFSQAPTYDVDLDFQSRIYTACVARKHDTHNVAFEYEYIRSELGRELGRGDKRVWTEWPEEDRYFTFEVVSQPHELDTVWAETCAVAAEIVEKINTNEAARWWRADLKGKSPFTCGACLVKDLCATEMRHGGLTDDEIDLLATPREQITLPENLQ